MPSGELLVRSNTVMDGYWNQPEETEAALDGGWFHTGDGGIIDDEGHVSILDRKKDVIITGGENVSSIEVEDAIFSLDGVAEVAVIGIPHDTWGEMVVALVVPADGARLTEEDVTAHCRFGAGRLQVPQAGGVPRRAPPHGHREAPEVQAPGPVLGREGTGRQLIRPELTRTVSPEPIIRSVPSRSGSALAEPPMARPRRPALPSAASQSSITAAVHSRRLEHGHVPGVGSDLEAPVRGGRRPSGGRRTAGPAGRGRRGAAGWAARRRRACRIGVARGRPSSGTGSGQNGDRRRRPGPGPVGR